jgi:BolA protein
MNSILIAEVATGLHCSTAHKTLLLTIFISEGNMKVQAAIEERLRKSIILEHLEIVNESHKHSGPATESHFKITAVADEFEGMSAVKRHQRLYALLTEHLKNGVHALALHTYTPDEWDFKNAVSPSSPDCVGGSH